jgi:hypothetical protein
MKSINHSATTVWAVARDATVIPVLVRGASMPDAAALPELSEVRFRSSSGEVAYRILAIRLEPCDVGSARLTFLIRMHNRGSLSQSFWGSSFRLTAGDHRLEQVSNLNAVVGATRQRKGGAFVMPASLAGWSDGG